MQLVDLCDIASAIGDRELEVTRAWLELGAVRSITNNPAKTTTLRNNPTSEDFVDGDNFRIVCEATDPNGNSVLITGITQHT